MFDVSSVEHLLDAVCASEGGDVVLVGRVVAGGEHAVVRLDGSSQALPVGRDLRSGAARPDGRGRRRGGVEHSAGHGSIGRVARGSPRVLGALLMS